MSYIDLKYIISTLILTFIISLFHEKWRRLLSNKVRSLILYIFPINFNIALSLDFKEGLNSGVYFEEIKRSLEKNINEYKLEGILRFKDCSDIVKFKTDKEAEKFIKKKQINLLIWGGFSKDNLKSKGKVRNDLDLRFTYLSPNDKENKFINFVKLDVNSKLALKNYWKIIEENSSDDLKIVSSNIFIISNYIIGLTTKLAGNIITATAIFENLHSSLKKDKDQFIKQVEFHLYNCYEILVRIYYQRNKHLEVTEICEKMIAIWPKDLFCIGNLATNYYKLNKIQESKKYVELMKATHPNEPITHINSAFILLTENKYYEAHEAYRKAVRCKNSDLNYEPLDVVDFLIKEYEKSKMIGISYGIGVISYYYGDRIIAENFLKDFLNSQEVTCNKMRDNAERLLKKIG